MPDTVEEWKSMAIGFESRWDVPQLLRHKLMESISESPHHWEAAHYSETISQHGFDRLC